MNQKLQTLVNQSGSYVIKSGKYQGKILSQVITPSFAQYIIFLEDQFFRTKLTEAYRQHIDNLNHLVLDQGQFEKYIINIDEYDGKTLSQAMKCSKFKSYIETLRSKNIYKQTIYAYDQYIIQQKVYEYMLTYNPHEDF